MLEELRLAGLGVIEEAALEFGPGLTVITGETGAGKTMVVTGLTLLFGGRADASRLRPGVASASVEGRLLLDSDAETAQAVVEAGGDLDSDSTLLLRRVVNASGRSRAAAGGASVPVATLARLGSRLLAVHGQSDQLRLAQPVEQRATLDRFAAIDLSECRQAYHDWSTAVAELERRASDARELAREAELLRHGVDEIETVDPQPDEDRELASLAARLDHADALRVAARTAHDALLGDADDPAGDAADAQSLIAAAARGLQQVHGTDAELDGLSARLTELSATVSDVGAELARYQSRLDADPQRLAAVQDRRAALTALTRKYGVDVAAVLAWAEQARRRLLAADTSDEAIAELVAARDAARGRYSQAAERVSRRRCAVAAELSARITAELAELAMPTAAVRFEVTLRAPVEQGLTADIAGTPAAASPDGVDDVELTLRPHPDAPATPVHRGASGGELSRVMLAIEVVLAGADPVPTMIFDEVDAGVGGRAAVEIGQRLARLAAQTQVIVVTHLAQVAAFADRHLVVDKLTGTDAGVTKSDIRTVTGEDRIAELARMLAGDVTPVAREHAAELLANAAARSSTAASVEADKRGAKRGSGRGARQSRGV